MVEKQMRRSVFWVFVLAAAALAADKGWRPLLNGKDLAGWEPRGECAWTVMPGGVLLGQRVQARPASPFGLWPVDEKTYQAWLYRQAWLYTREEFGEFDLHVEYFIPPGGNSGVSILDRSRAHNAIGEPDSARPELAGFPKTTPAHIGYEIQIQDGEGKYSTGSIYSVVPAKAGLHRPGQWNSLDIEHRGGRIRVRVNGQTAAEGAVDPGKAKAGPIGLQLHDQFSFAMFREIRIHAPALGKR
jgi:hypothetical protein